MSMPTGESTAGSPGQPVALRLPPPRPNGSILMATMIGLANALGMERPDEPTEMTQASEPLDDGLGLDFGVLRPLDD